MRETKRNLAYYRTLPYTRRVRIERDQGGTYFVAFVEELDALEADGLTAVEALFNLNHAFDDYITAVIAGGQELAEPVLWPTSAPSRGAMRRFIASLKAVVSPIRSRAKETVLASSGSKSTEPPGRWLPADSEVTTGGHLAGVQ